MAAKAAKAAVPSSAEISGTGVGVGTEIAKAAGADATKTAAVANIFLMTEFLYI